MSDSVTVFAGIQLAKGKTEEDLLVASRTFQKEFVDQEPRILRRELVKKGEGQYIDIVQFSSKEAAMAVMKDEMDSPASHKFFEVMDMSVEEEVRLYPSLETYAKL